MWPYQFKSLYKLVRPRLLKRSRRRSLHPELRLALTLSYLAHGDSMFSKKAEFRVGRSTAYRIVPEVCRIIWDMLQPCYLAQPTQEIWTCIADEFMQKWQFPNCIGAVDGKHIRIQCPPNTGTQYSNYKKYFSLVLMAVCDASYKFTMVDIGQFGSISDGGVWAHSDMSHLLDNNLLDVPPKKELPGTFIATEYALVGDEAFPLKKYLLRPYPRHQLTDKERVFNYLLSRARRVIENAFGILVSRWRILTRPLCCSPENAEHLVKALICLHNFVITGEREIAPARRRYCPSQLVDRETEEGMLLEGAW
ncbi:PREDICTED: putative nuclease HARBI1 [Vollenhovia emeryi]|uniref:putative nuclease HARBI1 n=1 Tax=Vollenhovia emeryi TaxID=411798 RepID=UPI0005F49A26|nr:PREDICTED: putative nuclease HARBI1 [Vollenhovia emeryi]